MTTMTHQNAAIAAPALPLSMLVEGLVDNATVDNELGQQTFNNLALDSRKIVQGDLFVAVPGASLDGREFIAQAIAAGAAAVISESGQNWSNRLAPQMRTKTLDVDALHSHVSLIAGRFFGHPSQTMHVTAITGTNAKTTCAYLLSQALNLLGEPCAMMGTIGSGWPEQLSEATLTTDDAIAAQRKLRQLADNGAKAVCMEVSSHGLDQDRVADVQINTAVFTNLSQDHLDYHHTMDSYAAAKQKLFQFDSLDAAVINADDAFGQKLLAMQSGRKHQVVSYGVNGADVSPTQLQMDQSGIQFDLTWQDESAHIVSILFGEINVPNLLATVSALLVRGYTLAQIAAVMPQLNAAPGRMELFSAKSGMKAVVDYSHTPDSLGRALSSLRPHCHGKLWVVFGCGGDRDSGKRSQMGATAANLADHLLITNDNPRSESPQKIVDQIIEGVASVKAIDANWCHVILDREAAIKAAIDAAQPGDMVLVAGKGHENTQTIGTERRAFSDRLIVGQLVEAKS